MKPLDPKTPIDCKAAAERLFDMLDGELTEEVEQKMRAHIVGCPHCYTVADFEKRFLEALHKAKEAGKAAPGALRDRVMSTLRSAGLGV